MTKSEIIKFLVLRSIGNFLVLFAIFGFFSTFGPAFFYEAQYRIIQLRGIRYTVVQAETQTGFGQILEKQKKQEGITSGFAQVLSGPQEQIIVAPDTQFSIIIPKIGASAKVFPNVDASNEEEFLPVLKQGIAHAKGTVFPGMNGNIYLFAHSTDNFWNVGFYNAVFYLLKDLSVEDEIVLFFENIRHDYVVEETKVVDAEDVSLLTNSQQGDKQRLVLQTCWPSGTTWKRFVVIAKPK